MLASISRISAIFTDDLVTSFVRSSSGNVAVNTAEIDLRRSSMLNTGGGGILQKDILNYYMPLGSMAADNYYHMGHEDHLFSGPVTFDPAETVTFDLIVDQSDLSAGDSYAVTVDKTVIDAALGTTDGVINDTTELKQVLELAFVNAGADTAVTLNGSYRGGGNRYVIESRETSSHVGSSIFLDSLTGPFDKLGSTADQSSITTICTPIPG